MMQNQNRLEIHVLKCLTLLASHPVQYMHNSIFMYFFSNANGNESIFILLRACALYPCFILFLAKST